MKLFFAFLSVSFALTFAHTALAQNSAKFKLIVNPKNPTSSLAKRQVKKFFLKKTTKWDSGTKVKPIDQAPSSAVRIAFSKQIVEKGVASVSAYWQQQIFSGRASPPPTESSDKQIVAYVLRNPGAIGYISSNASFEDAKVLTVTE